MTQITVGSATAPITIDAKMRTAVPELSKNNKIIIAMKTRRNGTILNRFTTPLLPFTFHLLLYIAITVQAVGMAITLRIAAAAWRNDCKVPELIIAPIHTSTVMITNGIARFFIG